MKTLIIIDVQNDFIPGGSLPVPFGDEVIPVINKIQSKFDLVIATQDWHPKNHKSFASNNFPNKVFDKINLNGIDQILWPDHCIQCSLGADFHKDLLMNNVELILRKGMNPEIDSYSAFYDNGHQKSTGLAYYLKGKNVNEIYLVGLAGDFCVYYSAKDAINENFNVTIIEDAIRSIDENNFKNIKNELALKGVKFINSSELD
ncbi:MAG: bifunctional nicotinamidase/pyrazinamidase [Stygiobacter sp.]